MDTDSDGDANADAYVYTNGNACVNANADASADTNASADEDADAEALFLVGQQVEVRYGKTKPHHVVGKVLAAADGRVRVKFGGGWKPEWVPVGSDRLRVPGMETDEDEEQEEEEQE